MTSLREAFGDDYSCINKDRTAGCEPGQFCTSRATCQSCPTGYACNDGIKTICPAGTYSDSTGAAECTSCPDGKWSDTGATGATECIDIGDCSANYLQDDGKPTVVGGDVACSGSGESGNTGSVANADKICPSYAPYCDGYFYGRGFGKCQTEPSDCLEFIDCSTITSCPSDSYKVDTDSCGGCRCTQVGQFGTDGNCCIRKSDWDAEIYNRQFCAEDDPDLQT